MYCRSETTSSEVCHPRSSRTKPSGREPASPMTTREQSIMSTSDWSAAAWRHAPQSTVTVTLQVLGAWSVTGCCSERSGPSRPDSPSFVSCPGRGCRRDERWSVVRTPRAAGRVSVLHESTVRTGLVHRIDDRGGTSERRLECLSVSRTRASRPYRSARKEVATSCKRRGTYAGAPA